MDSSYESSGLLTPTLSPNRGPRHQRRSSGDDEGDDTEVLALPALPAIIGDSPARGGGNGGRGTSQGLYPTQSETGSLIGVGDTSMGLAGGDMTSFGQGTGEHTGSVTALLSRFGTSVEGIDSNERKRRQTNEGLNKYRLSTLGLKPESRKSIERQYREMPLALVPIMNGRGERKTEIEAEKLVPGDVLILEPGVEIYCDARIIESTDLIITCPLITGSHSQSLPRSTACTHIDRVLSENMVHGRAKVVSGRGLAVVVATGGNTLAGYLYSLCKGIPLTPHTPIKKRSTRRQKLKKLGVRVKFSESFQAIPHLRAAVIPLGATGTTNNGRPQVKDIWTADKIYEDPLSSRPPRGVCDDLYTALACTARGTFVDHRPLASEDMEWGLLEMFTEDEYMTIRGQYTQVMGQDGTSGGRSLHGNGRSSNYPVQREHDRDNDDDNDNDNDLGSPALPYTVAGFTRRGSNDICLYIRGDPSAVLELSSTIWSQGEEIQLNDDMYDRCYNVIQKWERTSNVIACAQVSGVDNIDDIQTILELGTGRALRGVTFLGAVRLAVPLHPAVLDRVRQAQERDMELFITTRGSCLPVLRAAYQVGLLDQDTFDSLKGDLTRARNTSRSRARAFAHTRGKVRILPGKALHPFDTSATSPVTLVHSASPWHSMMLTQALRDAGKPVLAFGTSCLDAPILQAATLGILLNGEADDQWRSTFALETADLIMPRERIANIDTVLQVAGSKGTDLYVCSIS